MSWIESHQSLAYHPKTLKAARLLKVEKATIIGYLHQLWWWALDFAEEGNLKRFDPADIAQAASYPGDPLTFIDSLVSAGFLDQTASSLVITTGKITPG